MALELTAGTLQQDVERAERHMRVVIDERRFGAGAARVGSDAGETQADAEAAQTARQATVEKIEQTTNRIAAIRRESDAESDLLNQQRTEPPPPLSAVVRVFRSAPAFVGEPGCN